MSTQNKALMTHYAEGALISRELHEMMNEYTARARFEDEITEAAPAQVWHSQDSCRMCKANNNER